MRSIAEKARPFWSGYDIAIFPLAVVSLGHLVVDMYLGGFPVLFPRLQERYGLTYGEIGLLMLLAQLSSSVVQPLLGLWSDRLKARWILPAGLALSALGLAVVVLAPNFLMALAGTTVMGLGVAAYHPEASKLAMFAGGKRKAAAMSAFALSGNVGLSLGPGLMALGLAWLSGGGGGETLGALVFLPFALGMALAVQSGKERLYAVLPPPKAQGQAAGDLAKAREAKQSEKERSRPRRAALVGASLSVRRWPAHYRWMLLLLIYIFIRSSAHAGLQALIPLYYQDGTGAAGVYSSWALTAFLAGGAAGTLFGGILGDAVGARPVAVASFLLSAPLIGALPHLGSGPAALLVLFAAGVTLIASFSLTTVMGQKLLPERVGLASGLTLGFSVGTGGIGAALLGVIADAWGLGSVWMVVAALLLAGSALAWALPKDEAVEAHFAGDQETS